MQEEKMQNSKDSFRRTNPPGYPERERDTREIYTCKGIVKSQKSVIKNHISTTPSDPESGQYVCREMQNRHNYFYMTCPVGKLFPTVHAFEPD